MRFFRRNRAIKIVGLLFAFALIAAACGDTGGTTTTEGDVTQTTAAPATTATTAAPGTTAATGTTAPPATEPPAEGKPYGGEVVVGDSQEPPTLNVFAPGGDNKIVSTIGNGYFTGVFDVDGFTLELIPEVVTELPTVENGGIVINEDGTETIKYQIVDAAVWADGQPISGDDFAFTYETIMNPDLPIDKTVYEDIIPESVVAGPKTFEFTLATPTVQAELIFLQIMPKHDVEASVQDGTFIDAWNENMWVSGGPFVFDQWAKGEFVKLVRNDNYWKSDPETGQQLPYLDSVVFRFIPESSSMTNAFRAREIDMMNPDPTIGAIEELQALEPEGAAVEVLRGPIWEHVNFQFGDNRFTRNPNSLNEHLLYRQAVAHALDKVKIVDEILKGQVEPLDSYVEVFSPTLSQGSWAQYDYNPERAQELVDELCGEVECGPNGVPFVIFSTTSNNEARVTLSQLFIEMFADAGMEYEAQLEDSSLFFGETLDFGNWDLGEWAWSSTPGFSALIGIHDLWWSGAAPPNGQNVYRICTPEISGADPDGYNQGASSLIDEPWCDEYSAARDAANATVDVTELETLVAQMESILADNAVFIPLYARLDPGAVWADEVGGYKHNPSQAGDTWNMEEWYRLDL